MASTGYLRNFESGIAALLERGHRVTLLVEHRNALAPVIRRLSEHAGFHIQITPAVTSRWDTVGLRLRGARDYWRYLEPLYADIPMRDRAAPLAPGGPFRLEHAAPWLRGAISRAVGHVEKRLPVPAAYVEQLRHVAPDVLLLTPLIYLESSQVQWLRAAKRLGLPTAFCVHSWDNLTTKGLLHDVPSVVLVWNDAQRDEAVDLHGVDPHRCRITGALAFDHWFSMRPTLSRAEFLERVGLPSGGALILYLCSSRSIIKREASWVGRWLRAIRRAADPRIRSASIIVRPHPQAMGRWHEWEAPDASVRLFPTSGEAPVAEADRADYFHSLYYADAIVGLNTSALIEAAIFGKPVLSIASPSKAGYRPTLHFSHLERRLLVVATSLEDHVTQIATALDSPGPSPRCQAFVAEFVRPFGREHPASERMADAVEELAATRHGAANE
jgi:hypothetical protein